MPGGKCLLRDRSVVYRREGSSWVQMTQHVAELAVAWLSGPMRSTLNLKNTAVISFFERTEGSKKFVFCFPDQFLGPCCVRVGRSTTGRFVFCQ